MMLLLGLEWLRSINYFLVIKGELALFHDAEQIYWNQQRWHLIGKPLLLRHVVIINLKSRRNGKKQTLFLVSNNLTATEWRTLHYHLRQILSINKK